MLGMRTAMGSLPGVFQGTRISRIDIPKQIQAIPESCFERCEFLSVVSLPETVSGIGSRAFCGSGITEMKIPSDVDVINESTFEGCKNLKKVIIPARSRLTTICCNAFAESGLEQFSAPQNVRKICQGAFHNCAQLTSVELNKGLLILGSDQGDDNSYGVFEESGLEKITFSPELQEIKNNAFRRCEKLYEISLPRNLKSIGKSCFRRSGIRKVEIPSLVKTLGSYAFSECCDLGQVSFGKNSQLERIQANCFTCSGLKEFTVPKSVRKIE